MDQKPVSCFTSSCVSPVFKRRSRQKCFYPFLSHSARAHPVMISLMTCLIFRAIVDIPSNHRVHLPAVISLLHRAWCWPWVFSRVSFPGCLLAIFESRCAWILFRSDLVLLSVAETEIDSGRASPPELVHHKDRCRRSSHAYQVVRLADLLLIVFVLEFGHL